jgi:hypothetical protein
MVRRRRCDSLQKMLGILPQMRAGDPRLAADQARRRSPAPTARFSALYKIQRARPPFVVHDRYKVAIRIPRPQRPVMSPSSLPQAPPPALPPLVAAYVEATNSFDLEGLLAPFADDALVNDQLHDYWGKPAIREWATRDIIGERLTMHVVKIVEHYGHFIVTANIDGSYDKRGLPDPLVLTFYFSAHGDQIVQLIILRNQSDI